MKQANILKRINSVEDACKETGKDFQTIHDGCPDDYKRAERDIEVTAEALCEGAPMSERIYYPYFYKGSSGGGFSFFGYVSDRVCASVGARLRVDKPEKATHLGKILEKQYKIYLLGE